MAKIYTKNTWTDEVLGGAERYNVKDNAGVSIHDNVQIALATTVVQAGSAVDATKMNNIETGIDTLDSLVATILTNKNTETLTGARTLTDNDAATQFLNPGGAARDVILPAAAATNHLFVIVNTASTALSLSVKTGGTVIGTVAQGETKLFVSNSVIWKQLTGGSSGTGDVVGPASSVNGNLAVFDGTDGKKIKDGGAVPGFWTLMPGSPTRASNTSITLTGDYTGLLKKGLVLKWTESSVVRMAMVSIPSTYSSPNTTVTLIGDTMASIDSSSLKYALVGVEPFAWKFAVAGVIGATGADVANCHYAEEPMRVLGAELQVGTSGTTNNTTVDINKNGTTIFTMKPTLASGVATSSPFTADNGTSVALGDKVTIDQDAVQTTPAIDEYITLYVYPTRYNDLS